MNMQAFTGIAVENRLHSPVSYEVEVRGTVLVIIIKPGVIEQNGIVLPGLIDLPKNGGSDGSK